MSEIAAKLATLTQAELREVQARATALLDAQKPATDEQTLHDALADTLRGMGVGCPHLGVAKRMPYWKDFLAGASIVSVFVTEHVEPADRAHRLRAYQVFSKMLVRWMITCGIPASHRTACQNLAKVPGIVAHQFPGYIESGMLSYVVLSKGLSPGA